MSTPDSPEEDLRGARPNLGRLSDDLRALRDQARGQRLTVRDVEAALRGRGMAMLILILGLPFCLPAPMMGISTPFGLAIAFLGLRLMLGLKPWLPKWLLDKEIPAPVLEKVIHSAERVVLKLEKVVRARWNFMRWPGMLRVIGAAVFCSGLVLSLPILLPFTNTVPGVAVVLLALGLMEGDGLLVMAGFGLTAASVAGVAVLVALGKLGLETLGLAASRFPAGPMRFS
jgi:hypothetical protein